MQESAMTSSELAAKFPSDLGFSTIDVSAYPRDIQEDYKIFLAVCSSCHTPARAINAPMTSEQDWKRYVHRMHVKIERRGYLLGKEDEEKIVAFLKYDSKIRKIDRKSEFASQQEALGVIFGQISKERERLSREEINRLPKKETPYVGVK